MKFNYDGADDPTPCEVCGIDTLDGSQYCGIDCKDYAEQYWKDIEQLWIKSMIDKEENDEI